MFAAGSGIGRRVGSRLPDPAADPAAVSPYVMVGRNGGSAVLDNLRGFGVFSGHGAEWRNHSVVCAVRQRCGGCRVLALDPPVGGDFAAAIVDPRQIFLPTCGKPIEKTK